MTIDPFSHRKTHTLGSLLALILGLFGCALATEPPKPAKAAKPSFLLEALVDFPDDTTAAGRVLTAQDIDALMARLAEAGIRRVSWIYYADGRGGLLVPAGYDEGAGDKNGVKTEWKNYEASYREIGNPLKVAVEAGHRHGLEVYAYFKPYETGPAIMFPAGSKEARTEGLLDAIGGRLGWMDSFVRDHPELRIKRRTDDLPDWAENATVHSIRLTKHDAAPTRITAEHLQIWTSPNNFKYQPRKVDFTVKETVETAPRDVMDHHGNLLTRKGDPVRVLTLSGLKLDDKYILVTTDFTDGKPDFVNSGLELMKSIDAQGREIPGVFASGGMVWAPNLVDFRDAGLMFDYGWGAAPVALDADNRKSSAAEAPAAGDSSKVRGKYGYLAFARGRNAYLPGALCETEPEVRAFWLQCLEEMIAAGVDGVDFREENHSTHTDHPADYGYNEVVLAQARARPGDLRANIAAVRGEAYTDFLRACKSRLAGAGKAMRYNLQLDFFRPDPPANRLLAYPANIHFDWPRWIDEGLMDGAILRFFSLPFSAVFEDRIAGEMIARAQQRGIPLTVNRYVETPAERLADEVRRVKQDGRFQGFIFYEVASYLRFGPNPGECFLKYPPVEQAAAAGR